MSKFYLLFKCKPTAEWPAMGGKGWRYIAGFGNDYTSCVASMMSYTNINYVDAIYGAYPSGFKWWESMDSLEVYTGSEARILA